MSAPGNAYRGQEATAIAVDESGVTVGLLQGLSVSVTPEYSTLTGAGTTDVIDVAENLKEPELTAEYGTFDESTWQTFIQFDDVDGRTDDSADPVELDMEVLIPAAADSANDINFTIVDCRPETELNADPDSQATLNMTFTGRYIKEPGT
jgi:hypothetical protein